jgi:hypothetical protein
MGESLEEVRAGEGRLLRASQCTFEFVAEAVKKAKRPVLASGGLSLR